MHYLTLDTNTWIYMANGMEPVRILKFIKQEVDKGNIKIILPEIIINEWNRNKDNAVKHGSIKHFDDIAKALNRILKLLGDKGKRGFLSFLLDEKDDKIYFEDVIITFKKKRREIDDAIVENIQLIDDLFKHPSTQVLKIKDETYVKSGQFAVEKKAPFKKKNSFADALIVFSFIDYVKENSIEGASFISYNSDDFCEKKDGEKHLHPDLKPEFDSAKSKFYSIVGEAVNAIENNIVSKDELEWIKEMEAQTEYAEHIRYCQVCIETNDRSNEIYFDRNPKPLIDERENSEIENPNQMVFEYAKNLPRRPQIKHFDEIVVGHCSWCNTEHLKCANCNGTIPLWDDDYNTKIVCEDCGLPYYVDTSFDKDGIGDGNIYKILNDKKICQKCGDEFDDDGSYDSICPNCEYDYAWGEK